MHNSTVGVDIFVLGYLEIISLVHFIIASMKWAHNNK